MAYKIRQKNVWVERRKEILLTAIVVSFAVPVLLVYLVPGTFWPMILAGFGLLLVGYVLAGPELDSGGAGKDMRSWQVSQRRQFKAVHGFPWWLVTVAVGGLILIGTLAGSGLR